MLIPLILGPLFLFLGLRGIWKHLQQHAKSHFIVSGTVVGYQKRNSINKNYRNSPSFAPQFEYHCNSATYTVTHTFATNRQAWLDQHFPVGGRVELVVYEDAPGDAVLNTKFGTHAQLYCGAIFALIGAVISAIGIAFLPLF